MQKILSVIIPYYNAKEYTDELLSILDKQITDEIEVLLIDDGSKEKYVSKYSWLNIIRQNNGGVSAARNTGLDNATGQYVSFIDADDLVTDDYFETILQKIKEEKFDYMYLSWDSFGGWDVNITLHSLEEEFPPWNLCVWNRVYKRELIKDIRFNLKKLIAEDAEFIRKAQYNCKKKSFVDKILYHYRSDTPNSLSKKFNNNELEMERVVYNFKRITSKMTYLIDEVKKFDETAEVIIMTKKNDLPELKRYAMVVEPREVRGTLLLGEPTKLFTQVYTTKKIPLGIWAGHIFKIGGMETFLYYFSSIMSQYYDITIIYNHCDEQQMDRLKQYANLLPYNPNMKIHCHILISNRLLEGAPNNITYDKKIQMLHCCKISQIWKVYSDNDIIVPVSEAVHQSFQNDIGTHPYSIIKNLVNVKEVKRPLRLISCTRLTYEKGGKRMLALAEELNRQNIPFIWTIFSEDRLPKNINGIVYMPPTIDVLNYIQGNDYLVQLSDSEAFGYSIVEALILGVPVITTPLPVLPEIDFEEGVNGYTLPFDMKNISNKIMQINENRLSPEYSYDNSKIIKQWQDVLGEKINDTEEGILGQNVILNATVNFYDTLADTNRTKGELFIATADRAKEIADVGFAKILTT